MDADGTHQTRVTFDAASKSSPTWSPDGTRLAFESNLHIWVMNADGANPHLVVGPYALDPTWSPRGTSLAFYACGTSSPGCGIFRSDVVNSGDNMRPVGQLDGGDAQPDYRWGAST